MAAVTCRHALIMHVNKRTIELRASGADETGLISFPCRAPNDLG